MRLGIIGLPVAGKTTIFNALTGLQLPTGAMAGGGRVEVSTGIVDVPDPRVDQLSQLFNPRKTTYAKVTYADIGGLRAEAGAEGLPGALVNQITQMDGLLEVVRAFDDPGTPHPAGSIDPGRDLAAMEAEFLLNDMLVVERRLQKLNEERQRGGRERSTVERELAVFDRLAQALAEERPLRTLAYNDEERQLLAGFGLLTRIPLLVMLNIQEGASESRLETLPQGVEQLSLQGKIEMEIAQLGSQEAADFLKEYGLNEPGSGRVVRASYDLLGLQSFFTVGEDEVRAWTVARGATALDAAGTIHTDLARGFIRAEVIAWDDLIELGGMAQARTQGKLRVEGRDYRVCDGEVVHIRFNI
jgi:GTP-binding protein YchF